VTSLFPIYRENSSCKHFSSDHFRAVAVTVPDNMNLVTGSWRMGYYSGHSMERVNLSHS